MSNIEKGYYGYLTRRKKFSLIMFVICAVIVAVLIAIGQILFKTRLNLLMLPAMLCVIPAANYLVNYLAIAMFDTPPEEKYAMMRNFEDADMLLSDMVLVDEKGGRNSVDFIVIYRGGVVAYQSTKKSTKDMAEITVNDLMKKKGISMRMKVFRDWEGFLSRLNELELPANEEEKKKIQRAKEAILSVAF